MFNIFNKKKLYLFTLLFFILPLTSRAMANIIVMPQNIIAKNVVQAGEIWPLHRVTIANVSDQDAEIEIDFRLLTGDLRDIRIEPSVIQLGAGKAQAFDFSVYNPIDLSDGNYRAQILAQSKKGKESIDGYAEGYSYVNFSVSKSNYWQAVQKRLWSLAHIKDRTFYLSGILFLMWLSLFVVVLIRHWRRKYRRQNVLSDNKHTF